MSIITEESFRTILNEYINTRKVYVYVVEDHVGWGLEKLSLSDFFLYVNDRCEERFPREFRAFQSETEAYAYLTHMEKEANYG